MKLSDMSVEELKKTPWFHNVEPEKLKSSAFIDTLKNIKTDIQIVVAFRMLPEMVWNMPPLGTFNLHGSLLPKYRGAAPINYAIINLSLIHISEPTRPY